MSFPGVYLVVRRTLDWQDAAAVESALDPEFRAKYDTWNATFRMPYRCFRQRLKEIAQQNLQQVRGAVLAPVERVPPGAWMAPIDDDDWFAPDLVGRLSAAYVPGVKGCRWTSHILEPPRKVARGVWPFRRRPDPSPPLGRLEFTCETNGYAVANEAPWSALVSPHSKASRHFDDHPDEVRSLPLTLAVQNKSLASQTVLDFGKPTVDPEMLRRRVRRYRHFYRGESIPPSLSWAKPFVEQMADLMRELRFA